MSVVKTEIFKLLEQYPEHREMIRYFFGMNKDFKALCEDLHKCVEAMDYWSHSRSPDAPLRNEEYLALKAELEGEIIRFIKDSEMKEKIFFSLIN
jgi:hypothetical protein